MFLRAFFFLGGGRGLNTTLTILPRYKNKTGGGGGELTQVYDKTKLALGIILLQKSLECSMSSVFNTAPLCALKQN